MRKNRIFLLIVPIFCVSLALIGTELGLRLWGHFAMGGEKDGREYVSPYRQRFTEPWLLDVGRNRVFSFKAPEFDYEIRTNSEGMRDIEHPIKKTSNEYRIVALGDSFTMGEGAPFEQTWPKVLEERLNKHCSKLAVRVFNGGVWGSDPVFELQLLVKRLLKYEPDLVIQAINNSDLYDIVSRGGLDRFDGNGMVKERKPPWADRLWSRSHLARVCLLAVGFDWHMLPPWSRQRELSKATDVMLEVAERMQKLGLEHRFHYLVVGHPYHSDVLNPRKEYLLVDLWPRLVEKGVAYVDLRSLFIQEIGRERVWDYFWKWNQHCKPKGYDLFARGVELKVNEMKYMDCEAGQR